MQSVADIHGLYHLDLAHSALSFQVKHAGLIKIRGTFDQFQGYALIDCDDLAHSALMVTISTSSVNTGVPDRDAHLRTSDFLDVQSYPAITYVATSFEILDDSHVRIEGDLTVKDTTRTLELVFQWTGGSTDPFGNERIGFQACSQIRRSDYGLTYNAALETGGWLISDEVWIEVEASAVKKSDQTPALDEQERSATIDEGQFVVVAHTERPRRALPDGQGAEQSGDEPVTGGPRRCAPVEQEPIPNRPRRSASVDEPAAAAPQGQRLGRLGALLRRHSR